MAKAIKEKTLTKKHLEVIKEHGHVMSLKNAELEIAKLKLMNKQLVAQLEIKELENRVDGAKKAIADRKESHKSKLLKIAELLKIKGSWSFDPDTGIVKED